MKTLQKYLQQNYFKANNEWTLKVHTDHGDRVHIYIHPTGRNGETIDFTVIGNKLVCHQWDPEIVEALTKAILTVNKYMTEND